ncbi:hypothetical protein [Legionella waltersii]|uniref:Leucine-rich repeat-containing protein (Substrate of the Dot/Icm secretion system) n=1 Tax=Legionella waltersii TaxID=66969 RepID=A0A0W1A5F0_9GAMM|nr:hypothetical protein [Legionella waltersii]KTD76559.1 leucine-rich repeat-containing protein (substrate of the Dot/Icm secretion system) [Legionella waltersii]SNU94128.1 Leucine-rich repeat-containing protein Substrate of the Dot/Icm secretion system [Legionella waltersii]
MKEIPENVTTLNFIYNDLTKLGVEGLKTALQGIPENITNLGLYNSLCLIEIKALSTILRGIQKNITTLNLQKNFFYHHGAAGLKTALQNTPETVTALSLSDNHLSRLKDQGLKIALQGIPENITTLDLSRNFLHELGAEGLTTALQGIPENVTNLDLSDNELNKLGLPALAKVLATIPAHITFVHLGDNGLFTHKTTKEIDVFLQLLGENRHRYHLSDNGESQLARALAPMALLTQENSTTIPNLPALPPDVAAHILSFLDTTHKPKNKIGFFRQQLEKTIEAVEKSKLSKSAQNTLEPSNSMSRN